MKPLVEWLKEDGFYVREAWKDGKWIGPGKMTLFPILERVFAHAFTPDADGLLPYTTVILSAPKKSGKSTWAAAILAWAVDNYPPGTEIYSLAGDLEQAEGIVFRDVAYHLEKKYGIQPMKHRITMPNGTVVVALPHHYQSAAGTRHTITVWDELWAFSTEKSRRLWTEMTPIPTANNPLRLIVTYAGFENDDSPLRSLYDQAVLGGEVVPELADIQTSDGKPVCFRDPQARIFAFWHHDPIMPWQTPKYYAEQRASLRIEEYIRLHENRWVSSQTLFCPQEWWDRAASHLDGPVEMCGMTHPGWNRPLIFAVDAGLKHDNTAVVGCYYDPEHGVIGVASHRIWVPRPGQVLDLEETVEAYLLDMAQQYTIAEIVYDPNQMHRTMSMFRKRGFQTYEMVQNMTNSEKYTMALYDLLKHDRLWAYPDPELEQHVLHAQVKVREERGTFYLRSNRHWRAIGGDVAMDAAVALAMAAYRALTLGPGYPTGDITMEMPFSDPSLPDGHQYDLLRRLPAALRPKEFDYYEW